MEHGRFLWPWKVPENRLRVPMFSVPFIGSNESSGRMAAGERIMIPTGMTAAKDRVMPALRIKPRGPFWVSCQPGQYKVLRCEKVSITSFAHRRGTGCGRITGFLLQAFHVSCILNIMAIISTFLYGHWRGTVIFILTPIKTFDQSRFLRGPSQAVLS